MLVFQPLQTGGGDVVFERRPRWLRPRSSERALFSHLPICHGISSTLRCPTQNSKCGRSAEDDSSRAPLPGGRTPRPFAVRVPRGPRSTPPTVRAVPTPTIAGCSRAALERLLAKGSHLAARNPSAPPMPPHPTTLRPRPDSPACFAIATPSPVPRPPSALRSRQLTTFQVQGAGSTPRARHRADADRAAMGWLVGRRWAPDRQDSLGLEFGMLRTSLPLVLPVDYVCGRTSRGVDRALPLRSSTHTCLPTPGLSQCLLPVRLAEIVSKVDVPHAGPKDRKDLRYA